MLTEKLPVNPSPTLGSVWVVLALTCQILSAPLARAQGDASAESALPEAMLSQARSQLASMEVDSKLDGNAKDLLRPKFENAIRLLDQAGDYARAAEVFRKLMSAGAPPRDSDLDAPPAGPDPELAPERLAAASIEDLQARMEVQRLEVTRLKDQLDEVKLEQKELRGRPEGIAKRLPIANSELGKARADLALAVEELPQPKSSGEIAARLSLEGSVANLENEVKMMEQERLCQSVRDQMLRDQIKGLESKLENAETSLELLRGAVDEALALEAKRVVSDTDRLLSLAAGEPGGEPLVEEIRAMSERFAEVVEKLLEVSAEQQLLSRDAELLRRKSVILRGQMEIGDSGRAMAQELAGLRRDLPGEWSLQQAEERLQRDLTRAQIAELEIDEFALEQRDIEKSFTSPVPTAIAELLTIREDSIAKLEARQATLVRTLRVLLREQRQYSELIRETRGALDKSLFWMRSSAPLSIRAIAGIPGGLGEFFSSDSLSQLWRSLTGQVLKRLGLCLLVALICGGLVAARRWIRRSLSRLAVKIRRISSDRYAYTIGALLNTVLLALPVPLLIWFVGWLLWRDPIQSPWQAIGIVLQMIAYAVLPILFIAELCCRDGLGVAHFGWPEEALARLRRWCLLFLLIYVPGLLIAVTSFYCLEARHFGSVGRAAFILSHLGVAFILWRATISRRGWGSSSGQEAAPAREDRAGKAWWQFIFLAPIALIAIAALGYLITAINVSLEIVLTAILIMAGIVAYRLALRWFMIRERKIALAEALEERRSRREAALAEGDEDGGEEGDPSGDFIAIELDEQEPDLESIGNQTRQLLRFFFGAGTILMVGLFWSKTIPVADYLDSVRPLFGLSIYQIARVAIVIGVITIAIKNLPGLLELAILRRTSMDIGTRHAVATLCQYAVIAFGLASIFEILQVDWSKFGWIAAALSVGLGFGLQEVVANFVCGLILLFERPIRVGDIVTLDGITGKVTRIRIRATSVTDWDNKEFVVPNKNVITGTLLNWTLSSPVNRLIITVGVAYGTDTELARKILLDCAMEHPIVLKDPAPSASFEEFADSSLTLRLRVFLPDPENRIRSMTDLHGEIAKRFEQAGIEIAFPQQDLHLRSGWPPLGEEG